MLLKDLERDERIIEWFINKPLSASTKEFYLWSMKVYAEVVNMTPSELITEAIADIKSGKLMSERRSRVTETSYCDVSKQCHFDNSISCISFSNSILIL